jgi:hypothetical protein
MHEKEGVIGPVLENALNVTYTTAKSLNTDVFGTFTGETERTNSPLETARQKCLAAFNLTGIDLVLASEGSFGTHPHYGFVPCDEEILLLKDFKHDLEIYTYHLSTATNFSSAEVKTLASAKEFLSQIGFPEHAVILKVPSTSIVHKGLIDMTIFESVFLSLIELHPFLILETDMRAHLNPTRRSVIREATHGLLKKIQSNCPQCNTPGYCITKVVAGLPCGACHFPTRSILKQVYQCQKCAYGEEKMYPRGIMVEDPMYCDACNP